MSKDKFLDNIAKEYNTIDELKKYSSAQEKALVEISKKLSELEFENKKLKTVLTEQNIKTSKLSYSVSDEEVICRTQLSLLKQVSLDRQLTLEESRKVDIFSKILIALNQNPKSIEAETGNLNEEELLAIVTDEKETK